MSFSSPIEDCPLTRVFSKRNVDLLNSYHQAELEESVRIYRSLEKSERAAYCQEIFFKLSPFLLNTLTRYCAFSTGCGVNCLVADLLSNAYLVFSQLIDKYDPNNNILFLGYVINGLSWGIFNYSVKEGRWAERRVMLSEEKFCTSANLEESDSVEKRLISVMELERLLTMLKPTQRDLFLLHDFFGYSCADLAKLHNKKVKAVQKAIERSRKRMREEYFAMST